ncbi:hypothetical protein TIFTF001_036930 [Ficus carica]|uniref:Brf1 TBP-binding domain-containing protein n=1 Tax=Ficus carica TaxID=3494 RepID=A0AA88E7T1_FICCA|nr:hypothetical protein TIFTF001_036913 [Ficus carica]GMN67861.1 hypothetical protein TIFTF001_036921 [Ficus carica]GMN67865.1 hypothetical protein TIFTF001_036922 [Ficus carica]GMN67870.1 hypothetical protein TIFTF001_036930 [Ficus carica]
MCLCPKIMFQVFQHLNNKKEAHYKRMIWEAMNRDHEKGRNQKRARKVTKVDPTKQVIKPSRKMDNKKGLSSKINYDMLNKLMHDRVDKEVNGEDMDSNRCHHVEIQLPNDKSNPKTYSSEEDNDNETEHGNDSCEDAYSTKDYGTDFGNDEDSYVNEEEYD